MSDRVVFKSIAEMPPLPMSVGTTLYNRTGAWRYMRPVYRNRVSPCNLACPAGADITDYLRLLDGGEPQKALHRILDENPFPGVCGRVCPHPCELECNRKELGGAIEIHALERFLGDVRSQAAPVTRVAPSIAGSGIAVVGSGPAGLTCAFHLARRGHKVTVFEALPVLGGMMRVGIPSYRLPRETLDAEIAAILALGVEARTNMQLGDNLTERDLKGYQAVFLALGQQRSRRLGISGEKSPHVVAGTEFLKQVNLGQPVAVGAHVAVVGGGNTAMDAARSALRLGAKATVFYRRSRAQMPASPEEVQEAEDEGARFEFLTAPTELQAREGRGIALCCVRMRLGEPDARGRRKPEPIEGSEYWIEVDTLIPALGQSAELNCFAEDIWTKDGLIEINEFGATTRPGWFAGGDAATGQGTVAHAVGSGKRAALAIDRLVRGEKLATFPSLEEHVQAAPRDLDEHVVRFEELNVAHFTAARPEPLNSRPASKRVMDWDEVGRGLSRAGVQRESHRCFSCGTCNACDNCWLYCPDVSVARSPSGEYTINYDYCKGCGLCVEECPRRAMAIEEELACRK